MDMKSLAIAAALVAAAPSGLGHATAQAADALPTSAPTVSPVEDAPGRGEIPQISLHSAAMPALYDLEKQPLEEVSPGLKRRYLHGTHSTLVEWIAEKGAMVPLHHHENEQITWITKGSCEVYSQGKKFILKAGDIMFIPPNVPHEFFFAEDTIDIDIFTPQRQDWIDGAVGYYDKK
jgi:quercetin dioxygenase-like cupin family protein